jgi:hypothetical protein
MMLPTELHLQGDDTSDSLGLVRPTPHRRNFVKWRKLLTYVGREICFGDLLSYSVSKLHYMCVVFVVRNFLG